MDNLGDEEHRQVQLHGEPADQLPQLLDPARPQPAHEGIKFNTDEVSFDFMIETSILTSKQLVQH